MPNLSTIVKYEGEKHTDGDDLFQVINVQTLKDINGAEVTIPFGKLQKTTKKMVEAQIAELQKVITDMDSSKTDSVVSNG